MTFSPRNPSNYSRSTSILNGDSISINDDESPFDRSISGVTTLYVEPILNPYTKEYQSILTLSNASIGPITKMIYRIQPRKLSEFNETRYAHGIENCCIFALSRFPVNSRSFSIKRDDTFMVESDIASVFSYLETHGYTIDTQLTKITNKFGGGAHDSRRVVCIFKGSAYASN